MSANLSMKLNTQEILGLNSNIKALKNDIDGYLSGINSNLSTLNSAIGTNAITYMINDIYLFVNEINGKLSTNIEELIIFLDKQMKGYEETTVEATRMLRSALEFINENFPKVTSSIVA